MDCLFTIFLLFKILIVFLVKYSFYTLINIDDISQHAISWVEIDC